MSTRRHPPFSRRDLLLGAKCWLLFLVMQAALLFSCKYCNVPLMSPRSQSRPLSLGCSVHGHLSLAGCCMILARYGAGFGFPEEWTDPDGHSEVGSEVNRLVLRLQSLSVRKD